MARLDSSSVQTSYSRAYFSAGFWILLLGQQRRGFLVDEERHGSVGRADHGGGERLPVHEIPDGGYLLRAGREEEDVPRRVDQREGHRHPPRLVRWDVATYFHAGSDPLFDWGMTKGRFDLAVNDDVSASFELVNRSGELGDPTVELSFGWTVRW